MKTKTLLTLAALFLAGSPLTAQTPETADPHLAPLARLIGGTWHLGEDTYHTFEWGIGGRAIKSISFFVLPDGPKQVSETTFLYHPGREMLIGHGVAIEMGVDFFGYEIYADGDTITLDLEAYGEMAGEGPQRETWVFTDDDHYEWTLFEQGDDGSWERRFGGTFERRR